MTTFTAVEGDRKTDERVGDPGMLIGGGLFAGGVLTIAWERIPAWRVADLPSFQAAFAHTLRRVDRLQPALLVVCLISTIGFAVGEGARRASSPRLPPPAVVRRFGSTERRRSRTYRAVGYTTSPVLKTSGVTLFAGRNP